MNIKKDIDVGRIEGGDTWRYKDGIGWNLNDGESE